MCGAWIETELHSKIWGFGRVWNYIRKVAEKLPFFCAYNSIEHNNI